MCLCTREGVENGKRTTQKPQQQKKPLSLVERKRGCPFFDPILCCCCCHSLCHEEWNRLRFPDLSVDPTEGKRRVGRKKIERGPSFPSLKRCESKRHFSFSLFVYLRETDFLFSVVASCCVAFAIGLSAGKRTLGNKGKGEKSEDISMQI